MTRLHPVALLALAGLLESPPLPALAIQPPPYTPRGTRERQRDRPGQRARRKQARSRRRKRGY